MDAKHINFLHEPARVQPPKRTARKVVVFLLALLLLWWLGRAVYSHFLADPVNDPLAYDPVTLEPKQPEGFFKKISYFVFSKQETPLAGHNDDRINILLLGMGGPGHDGPYLTDTIIIASIKPSTNEVALISIPRDLGINIPGYGRHKINHANAYGETEKSGWGGAFATEVIADTFNIDIPYYVRIDFTAFEEIIDEVGGVTVNVERAFTDPMYPATGDLYQTVSFAAGEQVMDGRRALHFARSRHGNNGEGSDFARARRQQKILLALKEKLLSFSTLANPVRLNNVMDSLDRHLSTNMEFAEIVSFIKMAKEHEIANISTLVLDNGPDGFLQNAFTTDGAFVLEPAQGNFDRINEAIAHVFDHDYEYRDDTPEQKPPSYTDADAVIEIQNATWRAGLAARLKKRLENKSFAIDLINNATEKPLPDSAIYHVSNRQLDQLLGGLQSELHLPIKERVPERIVASSTTDILILLGEDFTE